MGPRGLYLHESVHFSSLCVGAPRLASWGGGSWSRVHSAQSLPCRVAAATIASTVSGTGASPGRMAQGSRKGGWSFVLWQAEQALASQLCDALETTVLWMNLGLCPGGPQGLKPFRLARSPGESRPGASSPPWPSPWGSPIGAGLGLYHSHVLSQFLTLRCCHGDKAALPLE